MATRLYGVATTAAPITPGPDAGWQSTTGFVRRSLATAKAAATESRLNVAVASGANNETLAFQLIGDPLAAGAISGTVTIVTRGRELAAQDNIGGRARGIRVVSGDGLTVRGTLLAQGFHSVTTELGTSLAGYPAANAQALSSVTAQAGDRIVVEIGYGMTTTGTTPLYDMAIGGSGTDHANANADATGSVPWVEFSQTLVFQSAAIPLTAQGSSQAQVSDSPALTASSALVVQDVSQTQSADNATLSTGASLAVADATQVQMADSPSLIQASSLTVQNSTHTQTSDNTTLAVAAALTVDDAVQLQLSGGPSLTQASSLVVQSALQAQAADSVAVAPTGVVGGHVVVAGRGWSPMVALLSLAQTGNGVSTNVIDRGPAHKGGIVRITTTVGATPTCTYQIEIGTPNNTTGAVAWSNATYSDVSTPTVNATASFAITSATTVYKIVKQTTIWRYVRVTMSANTNVTNTIDFVFSDDKTLLS